MVWGAIHHGGWGNEVTLDSGTMNRHRYIQDHMLPWARGVFGRNFVFGQDDAAPYVARDSLAYLDQHDVEVMDRSAMSPEMNPKEQVWD